jgi:hypothetical protein
MTPIEITEVYKPTEDEISYIDNLYIHFDVYNATATEGFDNGLVVGLLLEDAGVL